MLPLQIKHLIDDEGFKRNCYDLGVTSWTSCALLWVLIPVEIYQVRRNKTATIPWTGLTGMKLVLTILLILCNCVRIWIFTHFLSVVTALEPSLFLCTQVCVVGIVCFNRTYGSRTSVILSVFWFLQTVGSLFTYVLTIQRIWALNDLKEWQFINFIINIIYLPLVIGELVLSVFADAEPLICPVIKQRMTNPEQKASLTSRLAFSWLNSFLFQRQQLDFTDLKSALKWSDKMQNVTAKLDEAYSFQSKQFFRFQSTSLMRTIFEWKRQQNSIIYDLKGIRTWRISFPNIFRHVLGLDFILAIVIYIISDLLLWVNPFLLWYLLDVMVSQPGSWCAYLIIIVIFLNSGTQTILRNQTECITSIVTMKAKGVLTSVVYEKVLRSFALSTQNLSSNDVIHLVTYDTRNVTDCMQLAPSLVSLPCQSILAFCFLHVLIGRSAVCCLFAAIGLVIVGAICHHKIKQPNARNANGIGQQQQLKSVRMMKNILHGMKTIKFLAWEVPFMKTVEAARLEEMNSQHQLFFWTSLHLWNLFAMPFVVQIVAFTAYYVIESPQSTVPESDSILIAFVVINILCFQIQSLPQHIHKIIQGIVSYRYLNKFMQIGELDEDIPHEEKGGESAVFVNDGRFAWTGGRPPVLKNIQLKIQPGQLVVITGPKNSGKSALLAMLLGEMEKLRGRMFVQGRIAFVSSKPWLRSATIKENILFGHLPNDFMYDSVIKTCHLSDVMAAAALGDLTHINPLVKMESLNIEQTQQLCLARAVYSNADVYLMEDFLSDCNATLAKSLFYKVIGHQGILKDKTRLLVTNYLPFLQAANMIAIMHRGFISYVGPCEDAMELIDHYVDKKFPTEVQKSLAPENPSENVLQKPSTKENSTLMSFYFPQRGRIQFYIQSGSTWNWVLWCIVFGMAAILFVLSQFMLQSWADTARNGDRSKAQLNFMFLLFLTTILFCMVMLYVSEFVMYNIVEISSTALSVSVLNTLFRLPVNLTDVLPVTTKYMTKVFTDLKVIDYFLPLALSQSLSCTAMILALLVVTAIIQPISCVIAVVLILIYCYIQNLYIRVKNWIKNQECLSWQPILNQMEETVGGISTIRAFNRQRDFRREMETFIDVINTYNYLSMLVDRWMSIRIQLMVNFFSLCVACGCVVDEVSPAKLAVAFCCTWKIHKIIEDLVFAVASLDSVSDSVSEIQAFCSLPEEPPWTRQSPVTLMWPTMGIVKLKAYVSCQPDKLDLLLRGLTCEFGPMETIGIVGSRSEITSLVEGLFRFTEGLAGTIFIDGLETNILGLHQLRSEISVVSMQCAAVFSGTVKFNVDPFNQHSEERIWRSLYAAELANFVRSLPLRLHDLIQENDLFSTEKGSGLLAIARAHLRNNRIVIIDQTSGLHDSVSKRARNTFDNCTTIVLTVKFEDVTDCNRVMILDGGVIRAFDNPANIDPHDIPLQSN